MKRLFTLSMVAWLLTIVVANAQNYRKWDFTQWSAATIDNLKAEDAAGGVSGAGWSSTEKSDGSNPQPDKCFWSYSADNSVNGVLTANGAAIAETEGLEFNPSYTVKRNLAIAVDYPSAAVGSDVQNYAGPQYLWLGGGNAKNASARIVCFTIPKVKIGQKITMVVESHKLTEARGVALYVNDATNDANQIGEAFKPKAQEAYTWEGWSVPDGTPTNADGTVDILVVNTHGCHIYSIEVGDNTQKSKIAYLYQGTPDATKDYAASIDNFELEAIDVTTTTKTAEDLRAYDAVIVAANVTDAAWAAVLKEALAWTPIVNTSYSLYETWGLGTAVKQSENLLIINHSNTLFNAMEIIFDEDSGISAIEMANEVYAIQNLGDYFAADDTLGIGMEGAEMVTCHIHNAGHNSYIYVPAGNQQLMLNAIKTAANSKSAVTAAPKPVISLEYKDQNTNVSITSNVPAAQIFYTTDGSTPTESSTPYTGTFNVTSALTVKAVAKGDGYTLSEVAEKVVDLKSQATAPAISTEQADGQTTVTITGEGDIWYNYINKNDTTKSSKYTEPFVVKIPRTLYAFTTGEGKVPSETTAADITINNFQPRIDVLAHMDANSAEYNGGSTSTSYYFPWGKNKSGENAYPYYNVNGEVTEETIVDPETGDETVIRTYKELNPEESKDFENGWMIRARGQLTIWENQNTGTSYGNTGGYNFATVNDENPYFPATRGYVNLADKNTVPSDATFPYNAYIVTTAKYAGPFDIVINAASITKEVGSSHRIVLQVATDGNVWESDWQTVGDTIDIKDAPRLTQNITRSYEGTNEVYVRAYLCANNSKVGFYDIYIANAGEKSAELITGISEQKVAPAAKQSVGIYSLSGVRRNSMKRGLNIVVEDGVAKKVLMK